MDKDGLIRRLLEHWIEHDYSDIDGCDFHEWLVEYEVLEARPITEEECKAEWAQEFDVQPGDIFHPLTDSAKALLEQKGTP